MYFQNFQCFLEANFLGKSREIMGASEKPSATSKMIFPYCEALTPFSIDIHT